MKWKLLKTEPKYQGFFNIDLCHIQHDTFNGENVEVKRELFNRGDAVAVLLYDPVQDKVVLIEQFRVGAIADEEGPWLLEIVAGMVEEGESVTEVAQRECMEEVGVEVHSFESIFSFYSSPGGCSERIHVLYALIDSDNAQGIHGVENENEDIRVVVVDYDDVHELMVSGKICAAIPLVALQWLQLNRQRLKAESFVI